METSALDHLSPFELKDELIRYAKDFTQSKAATHKFLNAGRGNPNWIATTPREAFFLLGRFGIQESKLVWDEPDLGGMPHEMEIAERLAEFVQDHADDPGAQMLSKAIDYGVRHLGFDADMFVHELTDAIVGDSYPEPDRMLVHCEAIVRRYLEKVMFDDHPPEGMLDIFAVEGSTAAMCYVFESLFHNRILRRGDTIALGTPLFTPYVDLPQYEDFKLSTVEIEQGSMSGGRNTWQYSDEQLQKLLDPNIKVFVLVNPSNPASYAMAPETQKKIVDLVSTKRPDLILVTDDVYGTFVDGFRSLAADLPRNTLLVYSYSKFFGCTGWRLGAIGLHEDNIIDEKLAALPESDRAALRERYASLTTDPGKVKFIDRLVADSRDVALDHTAGLSTPQQVQMALFSLFALVDEEDRYQRRCREIIHERFQALLRGLEIELPDDPLRVGYYADFDLEAWGRHVIGEDFVDYVMQHPDPIDVVLGLARDYGTVLLTGSGFNGPAWSVRVSLANLDAEDYEQIGRDLKEIVSNAVQRWRNAH